MIKITQGPVVRTFPDNMLADICLEFAGGGYTSKQTIAAMTMQDALTRDGTVSLRRNGGQVVITMGADHAND